MNELALLTGADSKAQKLYSDDVFSAFTYTGNGSTQTITNGIDLAGKGGMVWSKKRSSTNSNRLIDTSRGINNALSSDTTGTTTAGGGQITSFGTAGYDLGGDPDFNGTSSGASYVSWTFRKAPKFFDVVTYTGDGTTQNIAHSLGQAPGMVVIKRTDAASSWWVYHRGVSLPFVLELNSTGAQTNGGEGFFGNNTISVTPTSSVFTIGNHPAINASGGTYVAYLFAHDPSADGIVQCGSFTPDASGNATVNLGWESQYFMFKRTDNASNWQILDTARGWTADGIDAYLQANTSAAEASISPWPSPNATGIKIINQVASATYIYLAIRRPNKPPTLGTQVYSAIARTGTGAAATVTGVGFAPDLFINNSRSGTTGAWFEDRLRGVTLDLTSTSTAGEVTVAQAVTAFNMDGASIGTNANWNTNAATYINWFFKRAPGVFDEVCYTGTGVNTTQAHSLNTVPEMMIVKKRSATDTWMVYCAQLASPQNKFLILNNTGSESSFALWNAVPTASVFSIGSDTTVNGSGATYVAYLFATKAGISKVFSYTGNGSSLTVNCGFTTGARWVMIKRTDASGDWYVWDSTRGIVAGNDPHLSLNTTAAEVTTDDSVDTATSGFIVNQLAATNINVTSATYIYLAFA